MEITPELLALAHHMLLARNVTNGTTTASAANPTRPPAYKAVGLTLAICSGLFIGTSFVLKKTGLLKANAKYHEEAGEGYGYLKNAYWWGGMTLMIIGEICNFVAYAFVDAILVTPLGALSVVVTTILSAIFLKERLSFVGKVGCFNCIVGSVVIVMNAPQQSSVADIQEMKHFVLAPGFLSYAGVIIVGCAFIAFYVGPRYGKKSMLVYLSICSLIGGLSVVATQGLGSAVVAQAGGKPQFNQWFLYLLLVFVIMTLLTEIIFLNKALNLFNAALVTPTYYVFFTSSTIVTSAILFQGFKGSVIGIVTVVMGFLQICAGVVLLQLSKSAKDVPDAAIFKGDLDQVREVAEQEQPETEPKADAIRGAAALIRRISTSRQKMEENEARRLREDTMKDQLEPLRENEEVHWDGLRRRKTIVGNPDVPSPVRRKTLHPPLGMSAFPTEIPEDEENDTEGRSFFNDIRTRAQSVIRREQKPHSISDPTNQRSPMYPVALTEINVNSSKAPDTPIAPYDPGSLEDAEEHIFGTAPELGKERNRKAMYSPRSKPLPAQPESQDSLATSRASQGARRQFSFTNVFHRASRASLQIDPADDEKSAFPRPGIGSRSNSNVQEQKRAMRNATEEERLGLVKGDSHAALLHDHSPTRLAHPIHSPSSSNASEITPCVDDFHRPSRFPRPPSPLSDDEDDGWQMKSSPKRLVASPSPPRQRPQAPPPLQPTPPRLYPNQVNLEQRRPLPGRNLAESSDHSQNLSMSPAVPPSPQPSYPTSITTRTASPEEYDESEKLYE